MMLVLLVGVEVVVAQLGGLWGAKRVRVWCLEGERVWLVEGRGEWWVWRDEGSEGEEGVVKSRLWRRRVWRGMVG